jgi:hypothetical protein
MSARIRVDYLAKKKKNFGKIKVLQLQPLLVVSQDLVEEPNWM